MYNAKIRSSYADLFKQAETSLGAKYQDALVKLATNEPTVVDALKKTSIKKEQSIFGGGK